MNAITDTENDVIVSQKHDNKRCNGKLDRSRQERTWKIK